MRMFGTADLDLLEQFFGRLPANPFFLKDTALRYVSANPAMARLCDVRSPVELIGKRAQDIFPAAHAAHYERLDQRVIADGRAVRHRLERVVGPSDSRAWLLFSRFPVFDQDRKVIGVAATAHSLPARERGDPAYDRLVIAVRHIRGHFDAPLKIGNIAKQAGISQSQLQRDFLRTFGSTMQAFLHSIRIDHAVVALSGKASIAQIAQDCGYSDHSAFTRRFRAMTGLTPREYRRSAMSGREVWRISKAPSLHRVCERGLRVGL